MVGENSQTEKDPERILAGNPKWLSLHKRWPAALVRHRARDIDRSFVWNAQRTSVGPENFKEKAVSENYWLEKGNTAWNRLGKASIIQVKVPLQEAVQEFVLRGPVRC